MKVLLLASGIWTWKKGQKKVKDFIQTFSGNL